MLTPLIAGNWKMNTTVDEAALLVKELRDLIHGTSDAEVLITPPFTVLQHISHLLAGSGIKLGGQNMHFEESGAFTGEVSGRMLKDVGCEYVILGHSERRQIFGETDESVNKKISAAIRDSLKPILCIGESLEERESGSALKTVGSQIKGALKGLGPGFIKTLTVAYEPVWAIGTGKTATAEEAEEVHNHIRELLFELFESDAVRDVRILYGGSVKPDNIDTLMSQPNIDGALVGGASLKAKDFARIVNFKRS